jgi:hypothetical protein
MASWFKDAWNSARQAVSVALAQATQAAQVAAVQTQQAASVAASQAESAARQAAPLIKDFAPMAANALIPGAGIGVSAFNKTNTNTTNTLTDSSVRVNYRDDRIVASDGSLVAAGNVTISGAGDPQAFGFGGAVASAALGGSSPLDTATLGGAADAGAAVPGTVGGAAASRLWLYLALGALALGAVFLLLRRRRK